MGLGIDNGLEAGGELKNPPENEEVASAASPHSLYFDDDGCHGEMMTWMILPTMNLILKMTRSLLQKLGLQKRCQEVRSAPKSKH